MEAIAPAAHPGSRDRGFSDTFAARPRAFNDRDSLRHGSSPSGRENRSLSNVPKGLETMLKTTTETGDIGMFSIKPPRVPQSLNTPRKMGTGLNELGMQKTRHPIQPYGVPVVDDRRRLPSYARDNSSDALSMYETTSQKSASRIFDDPDYRSYSMTQTSYSSYTLSNHRSYTSLRSQHDGSGLVQRPRSPFAYPTRLRRPGFRPSSPALTDGGAVDYSRRVEIDRALYKSGQNTASPSSLYAQKRKPPLSLRHEANRSTPSLLSQSSPPRRSYSPLIPRQNGHLGNDWQRRNTTASGNTSPARSTLSLASTVNLYTTVPISSTTTTPGKLHPPSPLYYDYTEDFEPEVCNKSQVIGLPPQFRIEKTIPEDRPMSADEPAGEGSRNVLAGDDKALWLKNHASHEQSKGRETKLFADGLNQSKQDERPSSCSIREIGESISNTDSAVGEHKKVIRLSGLGYGARELSCHVEEAFGLPSSTSFVIDTGKNSGGNLERDPMLYESIEQFGPEKELQSARTSSYSIGSQFPQFPYPPGIQAGVPLTEGEDTPGGQFQKESTSVLGRNNRQSAEFSQGPDEKTLSRRTSRESHCLPPSGRARARSSGLNSIDTGLAKLSELIDDAKKPWDSRENQVSASSCRIPTTSSAIPDRLALIKLPRKVDSRPPLLSSASQQKGKELQMLAERQTFKRGTDTAFRVDPLKVPVHDTKDVPNFSLQNPHKVMARSESPMLAPKPISPARQLKLKNSIPQIMKALPPLPPEPSHAKSILDHEHARSDGLTCLFSPLTTATRTGPLEIVENKDITAQLTPRLPALQVDHTDLLQSETTMDQPNVDATEQNFAKNFAPKLKLKVKCSHPNPWSLEESHLRSNQDARIQTSSKLSKKNASIAKQPKFKLRVIRASNSTQGTVRVTRNSENMDSQGGVYPSDPKDLFTPSPGIENVFRQFGRHLHTHSRKPSENSNYQGEELEPIFSKTNTSSPLDGSPGGDGARSLPSGRTAGIEARSVFSDDSSQAQGHHSLRKRISNLRTRITVPYTAKAGAQSYDDITWKGRHGIHTPPANQSDSNLHKNRRSAEIKPMRRLVGRLQRQRLKTKVRSWIKGARSVVARVKLRHSGTGSSNRG